MKPTRELPGVGMAVKVSHFGGEVEEGVVVAVHDGGRRLEVACAGDELFEFVLHRASARFVGTGDGARLELISPSSG